MTQKETVLEHLKKHGTITDLEAYRDYAIRRLGARIWDLRDEGYKIISKDTRELNRFGKMVRFSTYILVEDKKA